MDYFKIKNKHLLYKMQLLYGTVNIKQLGVDLGEYERQDGDRPNRLSASAWSPLDQSLVRRWLTGDRPVPRWAEVAIADLVLRRLGEIAVFVSADISKNFALNPAWVERLNVSVYPWGDPNPDRAPKSLDEMEAWLAAEKAALASRMEERK